MPTFNIGSRTTDAGVAGTCVRPKLVRSDECFRLPDAPGRSTVRPAAATAPLPTVSSDAASTDSSGPHPEPLLLLRAVPPTLPGWRRRALLLAPPEDSCPLPDSEDGGSESAAGYLEIPIALPHKRLRSPDVDATTQSDAGAPSSARATPPPKRVRFLPDPEIRTTWSRDEYDRRGSDPLGARRAASPFVHGLQTPVPTQAIGGVNTGFPIGLHLPGSAAAGSGERGGICGGAFGRELRAWGRAVGMLAS